MRDVRFTTIGLAVVLLLLLQAILPADLHEDHDEVIQGRHYRPTNECDRRGRCPNNDKEGHIEEAAHDDVVKPNDKDRPAVLTRDDYPSAIGVGRPGIGADFKPKPPREEYDPTPLKPARDRGTYEPKPVRDEYVDPKPTRDRGTYEPKPVRDEYVDPKPTRDRGTYEPKPVRDEYIDLKPARDRGTYEPKPIRDDGRYRPGNRGGGYISKPKDDEYIPRPVRGGGSGYHPKPVDEEFDYRHGGDDHTDDVVAKDVPLPDEYIPIPVKDKDDLPPRPIGGYNPKPVVAKDEYPSRPVSGGYDPKPVNDKDDEYPPRPVGGGGYNPKPVVTKDDLPTRPIGGDKDDYPSRPIGGGGYNPRPVKDKDDYPSRPVGGGGYNPRPVNDKDEYPTRPVGGYNPRPVSDKDDYPTRPIGGGGYNPRPVKDKDDYPSRPVGGGGYNPRPKDDYPTRPVRGGGGYNPRPVDDKDDYPSRPIGVGGYNPRPVKDRDEYPSRPVGGQYPKPIDDRDDYQPRPVGGGYDPDDQKDNNGYEHNKKPDLGGYDNEKEDDVKERGEYVKVVKGGNCICVPFYQCKEGHIVTDGDGIIDARKRPVPEEDLPLDGKFDPPSCGPFHVCCSTPESSTVRPYEHRCGVRNPSGINSRILAPSNKGEADFGEWPWQAAVLKAEGKVNIFMCGGVLIDKFHVITVAHCVFHLYQLDHLPLRVRVGEWDTQTTSEFLSHEDYAVARVLVHPEFVNASLKNDIAVLRLREAVPFAPHIDTVCLPRRDEQFAEHNCVVTGWGKDAYKGGSFSNVMKEVAIRVLDNYRCEEMLRKTRLGRFFQLHEGFLCAGGEYGLDSCKGDGGGPLVCYRKDKSYALAGIVSWGIDCGQPGVPGVYVKIQKYLDWISKSTGVPLEDYWPERH